MKINVIGTSGSGKSTLARAIAERLYLPYIEIDALYWQHNWTESHDDDFFSRLEIALKQSSWVLDGNYNRTQPIKWREVDMVVWVDYSFTRTLFQAIKRALLRSSRQQEIWPGTACYETYRKSFFSWDSIILWTIKTWHKNRKYYRALMRDERYQHIHFVHLRTPKMSRAFIHSLAAKSHTR